MKPLGSLSIIIALIVVAIFAGSALLSYNTVKDELAARQELDHQKLNRIIAQSLEHYFQRVQQTTEFAASRDVFDPEKTKEEDKYRYRSLDPLKAKSIQAENGIREILPNDDASSDRSTILSWQLFKGLPEIDENGKPLAEERRKIAIQSRNKFHDLLYVFEEDANGDIVFVVPFDSQKNLRKFNYKFRDYLIGPKKTGMTTLSEAYVSGDVEKTNAICVASPIFDKSRSVAKIIAATVSNETLRKLVFQRLKEGIISDDTGSPDTVFYFIDKYGHVVASSSDSGDYAPTEGAKNDYGDRGVFREYGPLKDIKWQDDQFEKDTDWYRQSKSWVNNALLASYSAEYRNPAGVQVLGSFYPVSLIDKRPFRFGILIETPTKATGESQKRLGLIFAATAALLLAILIFLGRAIWKSSGRLTHDLNAKELQLQQVLRGVSHDLRSPLAALQTLQPHLQNQSEEVRTIYLKTVTLVNDIANDLIRSKESTK